MLYKIIQQLRQEWDLIKCVPLAFVVFFLVGLGAGYGAANWRLATGGFFLHRDTPDGQAKKNELRARSERTAAEIRGIYSDYQTQLIEAEKTWELYKVPESERFGLIRSMAKEYSRIFEREAQVDFVNVDNDLRRRLGGSAAPAPELNFDDPLIEVGYLCKYAEELEQLAKRLPADSSRQ
jgi:hypothetical protein